MFSSGTRWQASKLRNRRLVQMLVGAVLFVALLGLPAPVEANEAGRLLQLINRTRASNGLGALSIDSSLSGIAQAHAQRMASQGRIFHNSSYPGSAGAWEAWGENVGSGADVDAVHRGFMNSASHRKNVLNANLKVVGIGIARWSGGLMVVEDLLKRPGMALPSVSRVARPPAASPPPPPPPEITEPLGCHFNGEVEVWEEDRVGPATDGSSTYRGPSTRSR